MGTNKEVTIEDTFVAICNVMALEEDNEDTNRMKILAKNFYDDNFHGREKQINLAVCIGYLMMSLNGCMKMNHAKKEN
jgi:hypothetical protein